MHAPVLPSVTSGASPTRSIVKGAQPMVKPDETVSKSERKTTENLDAIRGDGRGESTRL